MKDRIEVITIGPKRQDIAWRMWFSFAPFTETEVKVLSHRPDSIKELVDVFVENAKRHRYTMWIVAPHGTYLPVPSSHYNP